MIHNVSLRVRVHMLDHSIDFSVIGHPCEVESSKTTLHFAHEAAIQVVGTC